MNGQNEENLKELFEKFFNSEQAEQDVEDIQRAERILREHPAPEPHKTLIADIKSEIAEAMLRRKAGTFKRMAYKATTVAAAIIILAAIGVKLFEKGNGKPERIAYASLIPKAIWESDDIATDDADLAVLVAEIEQIEHEALAVQLDEDGGNGYGAVTELEMELIETNSDFWKG